MRRLLLIASEQQVPNVLAALHYQPQAVHLVVTPPMRRRGVLATFRHSLAACGAGASPVIEQLVGPGVAQSVDAARDAFAGIAGAHLSDDWVVLVSGGTKPMALGAYLAFQSIATARIVYMSIDSPSVFIDQRNGQLEDVRFELTVAQFIAACGATVVWKAQPSSMDIASGRRWLDERSQGFGDAATPQQAGVHLEAFVFGVLQHFAHGLGIRDVQASGHINLQVVDEQGRIQTVQNELDCFATCKNRLIAIECKVGLPPHHKRVGDAYSPLKLAERWTIVEYKLAAQAAALGALGVRTAFVLGSAARQDFNSAAVARARLMGIPLFGLDDLLALNADWQRGELVGVYQRLLPLFE